MTLKVTFQSNFYHLPLDVGSVWLTQFNFKTLIISFYSN